MQIFVTRDLEILKVTGTYPDEVGQARQVLDSVRMVRSGSVWGLEGVAEYVADQHKAFTLNKSGISKREAKALVKSGKAQLYRY